MAEKFINVKVFRFDPSVDKEPRYQTYQVPFEKGMSAMTITTKMIMTSATSASVNPFLIVISI